MLVRQPCQPLLEGGCYVPDGASFCSFHAWPPRLRAKWVCLMAKLHFFFRNTRIFVSNLRAALPRGAARMPRREALQQQAAASFQCTELTKLTDLPLFSTHRKSNTATPVPRVAWTAHPDAGLVLEGGGMRGVFTSGVLDCFMDLGITFPYCVAVSAGACNGLSYMSGQRGRARRSNVDVLQKYRYIGLRYLWSQHSILDRRFMYDTLPNRVLPFDYEACFANLMRYEMVATNCLTGRAVYLSERSDPRRLLQITKATSALPYGCPVVWVDHVPYLDGGITDALPVERAMSQGYAYNVVVTTHNAGYRDEDYGFRLPRMVYSRFPRLRAVLSHMHERYNKQMDLLEALEREGRVLIIRPQRPLEVGRLTLDAEKLNALYREGYDTAARLLG